MDLITKYDVSIKALYSIIQRAGVVPMSIAGMAKEVSTFSVAALLFGDEITPLNFVGLAITVGGKSRSNQTSIIYR